MASKDECIAKFTGQQICVDRTFSRLLSWAAYQGALPLPPTDTEPDHAVVRQRIVAERAPMQGVVYAPQICPFLLEEPVITDKVREHLSIWNDDATETALMADIDTAFAVAMPKFADAVVTDADVTAWLTKHGYPTTPPA